MAVSIPLVEIERKIRMQIHGPLCAGVSLRRERSHLSPADKLVKIERWFYGAQVWLRFQAMPGYPSRERPPSDEDSRILLRVYRSFPYLWADDSKELLCAAEWKCGDWHLKTVMTYLLDDYITPASKDVAAYMCLTLAEDKVFIPLPQSN